MTCILLAGATTTCTAIIGSGDRDTGGRGHTLSIGRCLLGYEGTKLSGCANIAIASTRSTESRENILAASIFTPSRTTIETMTTITATTGKAKNTSRSTHDKEGGCRHQQRAADDDPAPWVSEVQRETRPITTPDK